MRDTRARSPAAGDRGPAAGGGPSTLFFLSSAATASASFSSWLPPADFLPFALWAACLSFEPFGLVFAFQARSATSGSIVPSAVSRQRDPAGIDSLIDRRVRDAAVVGVFAARHAHRRRFPMMTTCCPPATWKPGFVGSTSRRGGPP